MCELGPAHWLQQFARCRQNRSIGCQASTCNWVVRAMACNEEDSSLQVLGCLAQSLSNGLRRLLPLLEGEIHLQHCMRQTGKLVWELYCSNLANSTDHDVGASHLTMSQVHAGQVLFSDQSISSTLIMSIKLSLAAVDAAPTC